MLTDSWNVIEEDFQPSKHIEREIAFGLSNGYIAQRANFEEYYSGETRLGSYVNGIYSQNTDKDDAGLLNDDCGLLKTPDWCGITVRLNEEVIDLATWEVLSFKSVLNIHEGVLERFFESVSPRKHKIEVTVKRFLSMAETEVAAIMYSVKSIDFEGRISFMPLIDANVINPNDNNEQLWNVLQVKTQPNVSYLWAQVRHQKIQFCGAHSYALYKNNEQLKVNPTKIEKERIAGFSMGADVKAGDTIYMNKYIAIADSLSRPNENLPDYVCRLALNSKEKGWQKLFEEHRGVCTARWFQAGLTDEHNIENQQSLIRTVFMNNMNIHCK